MNQKKNLISKLITKINSKRRLLIQCFFVALTNGYAVGFMKGSIYQGQGKYFCVPGLNCYSCPGAVGTCPIGALQATLTGGDKKIPYYVIGSLMLIGVLIGRVACGFLCPFGLVQDLLYKIKTRKMELPKTIDKKLRYLKYIVLIVVVIVLPILLTNQFGVSSPYFCKWICPSGTLFGGIPLLSLNDSLRSVIGGLFQWKLILLIIFLGASIFMYRPFCKYVCPLGAFYGIFNRFSFYQMQVDKTKCTDCKLCEKTCKMAVEITKNINSAECIRCGECREVCKEGCITINKISIKSQEQK